ncbi:MAG: hypothetical protein HFE77_00700 [Clostridiales bacterium]|nr:hypothetical protein [Clostridiales bacterium]
MYLGRYPDSGGLPPGYNGVAYSSEPPEESREESEEVMLSAPCSPSVPDPEPPIETCCDHQEKQGGFLDGILGHLFSHKIDMEDLLLIGLIVMLMNSKADIDLIIMLALLFVMGL